MLKSTITALALLLTLPVVHAQPTAGYRSAALTNGEAHSKTTLFDFRKSRASAGWIVVNDDVMGGRSKGGFSHEGESLVFQGSTNTDGGGFSSIRGTLPETIELGKADGLMVRLKATGDRTFKIDLRQARPAQTRMLAFRAPLDIRAQVGWQEVKVPFSAFAASWRGMAVRGATLNRAAVKQLGFHIYDKQDGPFRLEVERISVYSETNGAE